MEKYIECEEVKEKLRPAVNDPDSVDFWEWQCSEIDSIPAADVQPVVRAAWKRIDFKPCGHDYECSSCRWKNAIWPRNTAPTAGLT